MLIRRPPTKTGVCFAWTPKWTSEGLVWLEFVHWRYNDTEFGSYSYARWVPEDRYDAGDRRVYPGDAVLYSEQLYGVNAKHLGEVPRSCGQCGSAHCEICNG